LQPWINSYGFRSVVIGAGVPMAAFDQAVWDQFLAGINPAAVTLDVASGRQTQFQAGYRTIVLAASVMKTGSGALVLDAANTFTGTTTIAAGTLELAAPGAAVGARVQVAAGATLTVAPGIATTIAALERDPAATVDVTSGAITVGSGLSSSELVAAIQAGRGDGSWTGGSGISSSTVAADISLGLPRAVGWVDNGDGSMTVAYAAPGDTNLDWTVDLIDVTNFVAGGKYGTGMPATWLEGDFNYDEIVDIQDIVEFSSTGLYAAGVYNPLSASSAGIAAVPEPAACLSAVGTLAVIAGLRRRLLRR